MGARDERLDDLFFISLDGQGDPTEEGQVRHVDGDLKAYLQGKVVNLTDHENYDTLTHLIAETNFTEITRTSGRVSNITVWTDNGKTTKIREVQITRSSGQVSQVVKIQYDGAGVAITGQTITTTVNRSSGKIVSFDDLET